MKFSELQLINPILKALRDQEYTEPTSIQEQAIPPGLAGRDLLASAQTGTGKTAAFAIPIIQQLSKDISNSNARRSIASLIVTPTRELAIQIGESITAYAKYTPIKNTVIFGGVNQNQQTKALKKGVDILVATPGRLLDLMNQGFIALDQVRYFVLDEADRMLDMGFIHDVKRIIKALPTKRQTLFFSATMPGNIVSLSDEILTNPKRVAVNPVSSTAETVQQYVYFTNKNKKMALLLHILEDPKMDQVLLFSRTKHGANRIARKLNKKKIQASTIHGDRSQNQRQKALNQFKAGEIRVLVATDIAARGIDIDKLGYVINYDISNEPETYVHRIGRCGRAGEEGISISIAEPEENAYIRDIEKLIGQKIERVTDHPYPQTDKPMTPAEKKAFQKEKNRRRQEYFANRKKNKAKKSSRGNRNKR